MKYQTFDEWVATADPRQFGLQALRQHGDPTGLYRAQLAAAFLAGQQSVIPTAGQESPPAPSERGIAAQALGDQVLDVLNDPWADVV